MRSLSNKPHFRFMPTQNMSFPLLNFQSHEQKQKLQTNRIKFKIPQTIGSHLCFSSHSTDRFIPSSLLLYRFFLSLLIIPFPNTPRSNKIYCPLILFSNNLPTSLHEYDHRLRNCVLAPVNLARLVPQLRCFWKLRRSSRCDRGSISMVSEEIKLDAVHTSAWAHILVGCACKDSLVIRAGTVNGERKKELISPPFLSLPIDANECIVNIDSSANHNNKPSTLFLHNVAITHYETPNHLWACQKKSKYSSITSGREKKMWWFDAVISWAICISYVAESISNFNLYLIFLPALILFVLDNSILFYLLNDDRKEQSKFFVLISSV